MHKVRNSIPIFSTTPVKISYAKCLLSLFLLFFFSSPHLCSTEIQSYISFVKGSNKFPLCESKKAAPLLVNSSDYAGVLRVAKELQSDIAKVTNTTPALSEDLIPVSKNIVIIGTIGKSALIERLSKSNKIDVKNITGKWDTFIIQVVEKPFPGVDRALVIAGSNKRGTIYGMYDLSTQIGVSPWYYWADVPIRKHESLFVSPVSYSPGEPKIKYRGIFLNDEAPALSGWTREKFGGVNSKFYKHVFELILRLKGNFLWPAMWDNSFATDDTLTPKLADEYGVVVSTSHHEPMMRAWKEWERAGNKKGSWDYSKNLEKLNEFWREGIRRTKDYEKVITLAMRGDGDEAMNEDANIELLEKVVENQRKIIGDVTGKDPSAVPQVWALYKEVQEYYDKGMRVPDDVTILLCDDNWGNLRKLPKLTDPIRKGGYGIYYHFDYVGGPRNYKWLNTNQIERVWEQMHLAYEYGARQIWVVNVGDLKPVEFPINFFLDYAWNPDKYSANDLPRYYKNWSAQQFGSEKADEISDLLALYTKYNSRKKPEMLSPETYSLVNYREAESVVEEFNKLANKAVKIYSELTPEYKDTFYQLIYYPVVSCANLNEMYYASGMNFLYAKQGRVLTDSLGERVKSLFKKDAELSNYYNKIMAGGKWNHMMDQTHIGYTYWQQPDSNFIPTVYKVEVSSNQEMGVAVEGSEKWWPNEAAPAVLPEYDRFNNQSYYIELFNRGKKPFEYEIRVKDAWVKVSAAKGRIEKQKRIFVSIDWEKAPQGRNRTFIGVAGPNEKYIPIQIGINNPVEKPEQFSGYIESNNYISMHGENYSRAVDGFGIKWRVIPNLGRTGSSVSAIPVTKSIDKPEANSPHLEYNVYLFSSGEVKVKVYLSPTLNFTNNPKGVRFAISFDDETPQIVNMTNNPNYADLHRDPVWNNWVADNINIQVSKHVIDKPGRHTVKFWFVDPGVVLQKIVLETGEVKRSYLGAPESFSTVKKK